MALSEEQLAHIIQNSMFDTQRWIDAGRNLAQGMNDKTGFSSSNTTGASSRRTNIREEADYRDSEKTLKAEIRLKKLANAQSEKTSKMLERFEDAISLVHPRMKSFREDLGLATSALDIHIEKINERFKNADEEIEFWQKQVSKSGDTIFTLDRRVRRLNKILETQNSTAEDRLEAEQQLVEVQKERAKIVKKANPHIKDLGKTAAAAIAAIAGAGLARAGGQMMSDIESQRRFGTPGGMFQQLGAALPGGALMGVDPQLINEMMATNRAAVVAMGGTNDMGALYERLGANLNELIDVAGTLPEAFKFQLNSYQNLVRAGIAPTEDALQQQVKSFQFMQEALGMTAEEFGQLQQQLVSDTEFRRTMNGLNSRERRLRLQRLNDQIAINRANGMMRDQAIAAAMALEQLAGKGPRDRFKEMAKLQAIAAASGITMSNEARDAFIKGRSATREEADARQRFMSDMGNRLTEISSTMGGTGTELGIFGALEKAGLSMDYFDQSLTNLGEQIKMEDGPEAFQENFNRMVEQMSPFENAINESTKALRAFQGVLDNVAGGGLIQGVVGTLGSALGAYFGARGFGGLARGAGGLFGGLFGGGAAGAAGGAAGTALGVGARAAGGIGLAGIGGAAAGTALYKGVLRDNERSQSILDSIFRGADHVLSFFGNDAAQDRLKINEDEKAIAARESQTGYQERIASATERANELTEMSLQLENDRITMQDARERIDRLQLGQTASTVN